MPTIDFQAVPMTEATVSQAVALMAKKTGFTPSNDLRLELFKAANAVPVEDLDSTTLHVHLDPVRRRLTRVTTSKRVAAPAPAKRKACTKTQSDMYALMTRADRGDYAATVELRAMRRSLTKAARAPRHRVLGQTQISDKAAIIGAYLHADAEKATRELWAENRALMSAQVLINAGR